MRTHCTRAEYEQEVDMTLAGSFPASDPPSWTLGVPDEHKLDPADPLSPTPAAPARADQRSRRAADSDQPAVVP